MNENYLLLEPSEYSSYLIKDFPFDGFYFKRVCECISGYFISSERVAGVHFFKPDDINDLIDIIRKDFSSSKEIKVFLSGGGFNDCAFPWNVTKRNLLLNGVGINRNSNTKQKASAKKIITNVNLDKKFDTKIEGYDYDYFHLKYSKTNNIESFFDMNLFDMNQELKEKQFNVLSNTKNFQFKFGNVKDFAGFQNRDKFYYLFEILENEGFTFEVVDKYCELGSDIKTTSNFEDPVEKQVHIAYPMEDIKMIDGIYFNKRKLNKSKDYYLTTGSVRKSEESDYLIKEKEHYKHWRNQTSNQSNKILNLPLLECKPTYENNKCIKAGWAPTFSLQNNIFLKKNIKDQKLTSSQKRKIEFEFLEEEVSHKGFKI